MNEARIFEPMLQARTRAANAALTILDLCAWTYALVATLHAVA